MIGKTIGIPRGLFYYYQYPLWESFFKSLGFKVILSRKTDKEIVDLGVHKTVEEICYPVKIYYGHLASLINKVDYLFVPRLISVEKDNYICPKFMGLPDMIRANFSDLPKIIDEVFDIRKNKNGFEQSFHSIAKNLGFSKKEAETAIKKALVAQNNYEKKLEKGFTPLELLEGKNKTQLFTGQQVTICIAGHGYNLYDIYASQNIIEKLEQLNVRVVTPEMIKKELIENLNAKMPKKMYWTLGKKTVGTCLFAQENKDVAGLIYLTSFGCGPDSMLAELMERKIARESAKPFLNIVIDEHTGEAGLDTRLEAFVDMIARREAIC